MNQIEWDENSACFDKKKHNENGLAIVAANHSSVLTSFTNINYSNINKLPVNNPETEFKSAHSRTTSKSSMVTS